MTNFALGCSFPVYQENPWHKSSQICYKWRLITHISHCIQFIHVVKCPTGVHHLQQQSFYRPILLALNFFIIDDDGDDRLSQRLAGMQRSTQRSTSEIFSSFGKTFPRAAGRQKGNNPVSIMMYNQYHAVEEADKKLLCLRFIMPHKIFCFGFKCAQTIDCEMQSTIIYDSLEPAPSDMFLQICLGRRRNHY